MESSRSERVLRAWEAGVTVGPFDRVRALLREFSPHIDDIQLSSMTLGERDRELFRIRSALFGDRLAASVRCNCGERLEIAFDARVVINGAEREPQRQISVSAPEGVQIVARLPRVADLELAACAGDAASAQKVILGRCIESLCRADTPIGLDELPPSAIEALGLQLEQADPDSSVVLDAFCPSCGSSAEHALDIASFLWSELEVEALHLLHDVHRLARAYGWREADILTMSPLRRRAYMEMLPA
jgi:hypothetical protein